MNRRIGCVLLPLVVLVLVAAACSSNPSNNSNATKEPDAAPASASPAAESGGQWITGLTVASVTTILTQKGFDCRGPISFDASGEPMQQWDCVRRGDGKTETLFPSRSVAIVAKDASRVNAVQGSFLDARSTPDAAAALEFFKALAAIAYTGARPTDAQKWIETNSDNGGQTTFASAQFTLVPMRQLRIMAVGSAKER